MEFQSAHSALKWSYRIMATDLCKVSSIYAMGGRDAARNLTGQEQHGQAAMIVGSVTRAVGEGSHCHAYLLMQYGRDARLIDVLVRYLAAGMTTGFNSRRAIEKCVRSYCGQTIGINAVCADLRIRKADALEYRRDMHARLDVLHRNTMAAAEDTLRVAGLIEDAA